MELTGRMLPGTEIAAALAALDPLHPDVIGINCATGPVEMGEHLRHLAAHARMPISCIPNAGLPSVVDGAMHYDLTPEQLAEHHARFVTDLGVNVIGGCCGTTPAHLAAVVERCRDLTPAPRAPIHEAGATSIYSLVPFEQDTSFLIIGERTNANGSKKFREAMLDADSRPASRWPRTRYARAPTSSTSASTTWAATAHRTWTSWPSSSPPRPACRSSSTRPNRR